MNTLNWRRTPLFRFAVAAMSASLVVAVCSLAGCKDRAEGDSHDHVSKPNADAHEHDDHHHGSKPETEAGAHEHDDHEHGDHDHGSESAAGAHSHDDHDHAAEPHAKAHEHDDCTDHKGDEAHTDEVTLTAEAIARYGVKTQTAQPLPLSPTFTTPARVGFNTEAMAHIGSPVHGRTVEIKARLGDSVKAGDALLVAESPELGESQADYYQKLIATQTAAQGAEIARTAWERAKALYEQSQGISLGEVQKRDAEHKMAAAAERTAGAAAVASENRLQLLGMSRAAIEELGKTGTITPRHTVRAPIDGQVVEREVTLGELIGPDREALMVIADTTTLWVLADVPEARLHEIAVKAKAWVTIGSGAVRRIEGQVAFVAPFVDSSTRTVQVRIEVSGGGEAAAQSTPMIRPGMFAQVEIVATDPANPVPASVVAVPDEAVQTVEGGPAVFVPVKDEPNTFAKRAVVVGRAVGGLVPILEGLVEGEEFVAAGTFMLKAELGKGSAAHEH